MKQNKKELWIGIVFLILSVLYFAGSFMISTYSGYGNQTVDSKFMPRVLATMLGILSILQILEACKIKRDTDVHLKKEAAVAADSLETDMSDAEAVKENYDEDEYVKGSSTRDFIVIAVLLMLYVIGFVPLGFVISSIAFLLCAITFLTPKNKRKWVWIVTLSVVIPIAVYCLFVYGFKLKLPSGILNF